MKEQKRILKLAIYHLEGKIISRNLGRSSVAAASYRSAEKHLDERTGLTHDFEKKEHDILHKEILLPEGAPSWMQDRSKLWNAVEQAEKRKDAQLAREFNIALPKELNDQQNIMLAKAYVQDHFVKQGMVADLCIHRGHKGGEEQPHIHVMLTMREIKDEGFGQKVREWNDKALINTWREGWAEVCNEHLALHGHDMRIDHRTLEAQGIALEPQTKIGPKVAQHQMAQYEEHQRIARENGERLYSDPSIALKALTTQQSTFTHQDIARFVNRHTVDAEQFSRVYECVKSTPGMVHLGEDKHGRARYTTQEMLEVEQKLMNQVGELSQTNHHVVADKYQSNVLRLRASQGKPLSAEQKDSLNHILSGKDVACVVGYAGTGKSYMLGAAKEAWEAQGYKVQGMTLSGIAAENLEGGSGIKSHTVANRLTCWENDRERLTSKDIVVVDEAGMLGTRQLAQIVNEVKKQGSKVVLVGDPEQLQAIAAGPAFRGVIQEVGYSELTEIRRQKHEWQQKATRDLAQAKTVEAISQYEAKDCVYSFNQHSEAINAMVEGWQEVRSNNPNQTQLMLAYTRAEVAQLNEKAREARRGNGELVGQDHLLQTVNGKRAFVSDDRIYFLKNEKSLGVKNGTLGTVEHIHDGKLIVRTDGSDLSPSKQVTFSIKDYEHIDHGYAATVYKAQGVTVDRAHVLASKYFDRHSTYVALSRHKESVCLYWSHEEFKDFKTMRQNLGQARHKDLVGDYARVRGLEPENPGKLDIKPQSTRLSHKEPEQQKQTSQQIAHVQRSSESTRSNHRGLLDDNTRNAAQRLAQRKHENEIKAKIAYFEERYQISVTTKIENGAKGIYSVNTSIEDKDYVLIEKAGEEKQYYLVNKAMVEKCQKGEDVQFKLITDKQGQTRLIGYSQESIQREMKQSQQNKSQSQGRWGGLGKEKDEDRDRGRGGIER